VFYRLRRSLRRRYAGLFHRIDRPSLDQALAALGLRRGDLVCVQSQLSAVGHFVGGTEMIVDALMGAVGGEGTVMMPSFPTRGSMLQYVEGGEVFDVRSSPSRVGELTEAFRRRPAVSRSLHPTNPVCAWGPQAASLLRDHEESRTPYGRATPYGRLAEADNGHLLLLGVPILSLMHHVQERVDFPNLYLPGTRPVPYVDGSGRTRSLETQVMRPRIPYFVAVPSSGGGAPDWAILHDFALMFPRGRERAVRDAGYRFDGYPKLWGRRAELESLGILRAVRLGREEIGVVKTRSFVAYVETELRELICRFRDHYDPDRIAAMNLRYF
jgi:aminoglycoside 3-N-acetyltransferase